MKPYLLFGLIFAIFPMLFLAIGISFGINTLIQIDNAEMVNGTVVSHEEKQDSDGATYASIVEFNNPEGKVCKDTETIYSSPKPNNIGKSVKVYIGNDGKITIGTFSNLWFFPLIFSLIALPFLIIGVIFLSIYFKIKMKIDYLQNYGKKIESTKFKIEQNRTLSINRKHPYYIEGSFIIDGKEYTAKSELSMKPIKIEKNTVEILYDPNNPEKNILVL